MLYFKFASLLVNSCIYESAIKDFNNDNDDENDDKYTDVYSRLQEYDGKTYDYEDDDKNKKDQTG